MPKDHIQTIDFSGSAVSVSFHNPTPADERDDPTADHSAKITFKNADQLLAATKEAINEAQKNGIKTESSSVFAGTDRELKISKPSLSAKTEVKTAWNKALNSLGSRLSRLAINEIYVDSVSRAVSLRLEDKPITIKQRIDVIDDLVDRKEKDITAESAWKYKNEVAYAPDEILTEPEKALNITTAGITVSPYANKLGKVTLEIKQSVADSQKILIKAKPVTFGRTVRDEEKIKLSKQFKEQLKDYLRSRKIANEEASEIDESTSWSRFDSYDANGVYVTGKSLDEVIKALATERSKSDGSNLILSVYASDDVQEAIRANTPSQDASGKHAGRAKRSRGEAEAAIS